MTFPLSIGEHVPVEVRIEQVRAELSVQLVELELRITKWMFVCLILTFAIAALLAIPTLRSPALAMFLAGSAVQMYAVWRM